MRAESRPTVAQAAAAARSTADRARRGARTLAVAAVATLVATGLVAAPAPPTAWADTAPTGPGPVTVAADGLPTAQIDGVAYAQVVVGDTVYVGGAFATARPAGAAPGTATVARRNLLAYDLRTGALVGTWRPRLNGAAYALAASPDGSRIYVGGEFTTVNGVPHRRFVALDAGSGRRVPGFARPDPNGTVRAIATTSSAVYLGGNFNAVHGRPRARLAAVGAATGALLSWQASADLVVEALTVSPDGSRVIAGGRFQWLSGARARGSGAVSATTGAALPWEANRLITNYGWDAGITSLSTDGTLVYGSGFAFLDHAGGYGNLEGVFAADPDTGRIRWIEDCHGDTYSVYPNPGGDHVYTVGHAHFCGNIGGFASTSRRSALAFSKQDVMTITPNTVPFYFDFAGQRAPRLLHFFPHLEPGTATAARQAAWSVTGSGDYVVMAGEFTAVNGRPQQGLVRMARPSVAPNAVGPVLTGRALQPVATSRASGTAQVSWPANWDRDNAALTYLVLRDGAATPVHTTTGTSLFTQMPRLSFTDTGLTPGRTHSYVVVARDAWGNEVASPPVTVRVAGPEAGALSAYAREVMDDNPAGYWRLGESGGRARDWTGFADLTVGPAAARAVPGALAGDPDGAVRLGGTASSRLHGGRTARALNRFSVEAWFRTDPDAGGTIVGYGASHTARSSPSADRHLYVGTDGLLRFGVDPGVRRTLTAATPVDDGAWHHAVGTLGPDGMRLYLDGVLQAEDPDTISAAGLPKGYWRIGGDRLARWPGAGRRHTFIGDVDEVAVYPRPLTAAEVASHRSVGVGPTAGAPVAPDPVPPGPAGPGPVGPDPGPVGPGAGPAPDGADGTPTASFTAVAAGLRVDVDASGSPGVGGAGVTVGWSFGDGATASGATAAHTYAVPGTYTVTVTVTDGDGRTATTGRAVTVGGTAPPGGTAPLGGTAPPPAVGPPDGPPQPAGRAPDGRAPDGAPAVAGATPPAGPRAARTARLA